MKLSETTGRAVEGYILAHALNGLKSLVPTFPEIVNKDGAYLLNHALTLLPSTRIVSNAASILLLPKSLVLLKNLSCFVAVGHFSH